MTDTPTLDQLVAAAESFADHARFAARADQVTRALLDELDDARRRRGLPPPPDRRRDVLREAVGAVLGDLDAGLYDTRPRHPRSR